MEFSQEKRFLITLNHLALELLKIKSTIQFMLEANGKLNSETLQLNNTLEAAEQEILLQITNVSKYLKGDENILRAYKEANAGNLKIK